MSQQILQVNFKFNVPRSQLESFATQTAQDFANVPGCVWKVWLMNDGQREAGGIYLFADRSSAEAFKASPLMAGVLSSSALSDFSLKQFDVLEDVSRVTRAPLGQPVPA